MITEIVSERADMVIRRMVLEPGERSPWHTDPCRRFTVVVHGERLAIEYLDSAQTIEVAVLPGVSGWDEPEPRIHRAINVGSTTYEEVVTFYRPTPHADPQPRHHEQTP